MSDQDRGAYAPQTDAPLAFDARQARGGGGPAPLTLLVSAIVLMALIVGLLLFYRHGVRHAGQPPQIVGAPVTQTKSAPPSDATPSDQAAGLQVYKGEAPPSGESPPPPTFAGQPEQPAPLPAPRPAAAAPAILTAPLRGSASASSAPPPPRPPKPVVIARAAAPPPPVAVSDDVAGSAFGNHTAPPAPAPRIAKPVVGADETASTAEGATKTKAKAKPAAAVVAPAAAVSGGVTAQVGAFSSAALAQQGWTDAARAAPDQIAGKGRKVEMTTKDGKTYYRSYVVGFASKAAAASFCETLHAKTIPCMVK